MKRESNPVLLKELRGRMRGARAFIVLTVYLLLLSCFTSLIYYAYTRESGGSDMAYVGKVIFASVVIIEIFMVTFITPAFTAGAISGERERQTYELLRTTLLSARKLVFGKLSSALVYMLLLILAAVPLESLAFVLGGVIGGELAAALVVLLATAFAFAAIGLFYSAFARTTLAATVWAYVTALILTIGLPILMLIGIGIWDAIQSTLRPTSWVIEAILGYVLLFILSLSPISTAIATEIMLDEENSLFYFWYNVGGGYTASMTPAHRVPVISPWIVYTLIYLVVGAVLLFFTVLRVRRQEK